jgi:hypothetical protein
MNLTSHRIPTTRKYCATFADDGAFSEKRDYSRLATTRRIDDKSAMNKQIFLITLVSLALVTLLRAQSPAPAGSPKAVAPVKASGSPSGLLANDPEKYKMIIEMMEYMQTSHFAEDMMAQTLSAMKSSVPGVPDSFWADFQKKLSAKDLQERLISIYDRYFTKDDLKAALAFYQTPSGQKMLSEMPALVRDSMAAGQEWGRKTGEEAARELDQRGLLRKPSPAASASPKPSASTKP